MFYEKKYKSIYFYFIIIFLILGSLLAGTTALLYHRETSDFIKRIKTEETIHNDFHVEVLSNCFATVISDLAFLKEQNELKELINTGNRGMEDKIAEEYLQLAAKKGYYDQIRFIDETGMERVRVNYNGGNPYKVNNDSLQLKKNRYYFQDTIKLSRDSFFISPLDLNIENGKIEIPFKPMIRFASPVTDNSGIIKGIVILNYLAEKMIENLDRKTNMSTGTKMVINSDGYWLHCSIEENEWGFMLPERKDKNFTLFYPSEWDKINSKDEIQIRTENGLFTSTTFYPASFYKPSDDNSFKTDGAVSPGLSGRDYYWKIISHISTDKLRSETELIMIKFFSLGTLLFFFAAFPAWLTAQTIINGKLRRIKLFRSANFDKLTDLPNRAYLMSSLNQIISESRRYDRKFAVLYLDLDGFKEVNDTSGHDAGDQVLIQTAERFKNCTRDSDIVSRPGGDEFIIILPSIKSHQSAVRAAEKIILSTKEPFKVKDTYFKIGVSIGISIYPEHGDEINSIVNNADSAMYEVKKQGKNNFAIYSE